ncbi:P-loop containing nucleoside triphosphate hydrolases superfamily protein isoform X2 [Wolffia australiana]
MSNFAAAAKQAILRRLPFVDLTVEIPLSSAFQPLAKEPFSRRRIVILNKIDLAEPNQTEIWINSFKERSSLCFGVNAHNEGSIKELLNLLVAHTKALQGEKTTFTSTVMLVGAPNVGKSAIANALHRIGRISAEEKGKFRRANVSSKPGETKDIRAYKIASHPNIYVLDTPGILFPEISDTRTASKLALTGIIEDCFIGQCALARYFLSILNSKEEYKRWKSLNGHPAEKSLPKRRQYPSDHTQDFIVLDVRRTLFRTISMFEGCLTEEAEMTQLISLQIAALREDFRVPAEETDVNVTVASKLLNLYQTGRLGRYTLESLHPQVCGIFPNTYGRT